MVISDIPGFDDEAKISMAFDRLSQRFGVRGGFVNEPEIRQVRNGPKTTSTSAAAWKTFKDELTECFVFVHSYKKPELLEGRLVVDLSRRLPTYAKQRFLNFLSDRFGSTSGRVTLPLPAYWSVVVRSTHCSYMLFSGPNS